MEGLSTDLSNGNVSMKEDNQKDQVLQTFQDVFKEAERLPQPRILDHFILSVAKKCT